jgi:large subunit ribosomal protein L15
MSDSTPDVIKIHDLRPAPGAKTAKKRVGRGEGGKGGKTAGRGTKGTKARKTVSPAFEGGQMPLHMRLPKLKGFRNRFRTEYQVVNVGDLARLFPEGGEIGPQDLVEAGAVRRNQLVKVLGEGELEGVTLTVTARLLRQCPGQDHGRRRYRPTALTSHPGTGRAGRHTTGPRRRPRAITTRRIPECSARSGRPWPRRTSGRRSSSRS